MNLDALMDTPRIYTALAEWGACILYVLLLRRKVTGWKLPVSLAGSLLVFIAYQEFAGTLPIYFWIPCMIGAAFLMCLLLHLLCDTTWLDAGFCCAQALVLAEFTASFHWQLYVWWALNYAKNSRLFSTLTMLLLYTGIYLSLIHIWCIGDTTRLDARLFEVDASVDKVMHVQEPYKLSNRAFHPEDSIIDVSGVKVGGDNLALIAGPCSVESYEQVLGIAKSVKAAGANMLRGGAFKPRTSPYSFQGLGLEGLDILCAVKEETGLPIVTELMLSLIHI